MPGPNILVDSFTSRGVTCGYQYNSRSDWHSVLTCWTAIFDLLRHARDKAAGGMPSSLWQDLKAGRLGFGINHTIVSHAQEKRIDIVICEVIPTLGFKGKNFADIPKKHSFAINQSDDITFLNEIKTLPFYEVDSAHMGEVRIAIEAKAAMSDLVKAIPRLFAEILATGIIVRDAQTHRAWGKTVVASVNLINTATAFKSSTKGEVKKNGTSEATSVLNMLATAFFSGIASKAFNGTPIYSAVGALLIECENDPKKAVTLHPTNFKIKSSITNVPRNIQYQQMIIDIFNNYQN